MDIFHLFSGGSEALYSVMMHLGSRSRIYLNPTIRASFRGTTCGVAAHTVPWTCWLTLQADMVLQLGCPVSCSLFIGSPLSRKQPTPTLERITGETLQLPPGQWRSLSQSGEGLPGVAQGSHSGHGQRPGLWLHQGRAWEARSGSLSLPFAGPTWSPQGTGDPEEGCS